MNTTRWMALVLVATAALTGCAQDVGDIDRTQPYRLKKSLFEGEWYLQRTIFDVPYTAGFTFTGETSDLERIRWQIERGFLIAYRAYDFVENTNANAALPDVELKGAPIAAYAIEEHFDVVRDYNTLTGEETNVLLENTVDRPWFERAHMRVDWSKNLMLNFSFIADGVGQSPVNYFIQDRTDADTFMVGVQREAGWEEHHDWRVIADLDQVDYLDIVDVLFAEPESLVAEDEYGGLEEYPACWFYTASDCQPSRLKVRSSFLKVNPAERYEAMAYPDNEILRDPDGNALRDEFGSPIRVPYFDKFGYFRIERDYFDAQRGRTQSGRTFLITRWGIWQDAPECVDASGSYRNCTVRPVVYHLSPGFPTALVPQAAESVAQWNAAFKEVVLHKKYGGVAPPGGVEDVFLLRPNSYEAGVTRGERIGDLRYSFLYYVAEPQSAGLLGYGPSAADPLTGRIISGSAYVYGAETEIFGTWGADIVDLLNGVIPSDEFLEGEDVREYVARAHGEYDRVATAAGNAERLDRAREFARSRNVKQARGRQKSLGKQRFRLDRSEVRARLSAIKDSPLEERLMNDEIVRALVPSARQPGSGLSASLSPATRAKISPARWATTGAFRDLTQKRRRKLMENSVTLAAFSDPAVIGLAESLRGKQREEVRRTIIGEVFASTMEHELGHTLGLRHNFGGSYDSLNYHPQYWTTRGNDPQPFQAMTPGQQTARQREYQYSSIMDYGARVNSDIQGIGPYDRAAIKFGYGELVDVFEPDTQPADPLGDAFGYTFAMQELRHYTSLPSLFGNDASRINRRRTVPYSNVIDQLKGSASTSFIEVPFRFCSDEYEGALSWCAAYDEGADPYEIVQNASDQYETYYIFNNFSRDRQDIESWSHLENVFYRFFFPIQNQYQQWFYSSWDYDGLWEYLREDPAYWQIEDVPYDEAIDGGLAGAFSARTGLNTLARVIQTPEPGAYYYDPDEQLFLNYSYEQIPVCGAVVNDECSDMTVPLGTGKYAFSLYDGDSGYYFYDRLQVVGSFYDKLAAVQTLTSPETNFLGVDFDANLTQFAIGMNLVFPDEVTRLVGGSATEAYSSYAGFANSQGSFVYRDMFTQPSGADLARPVDPATSFTVELYAAWLGMAFLNASFDNSFNDKMKIFIEGNGEGILPSASPERIARYQHPRTGRTFVAIRAEQASEFSPGFELVNRVQQIANEPTEYPEYQESRIELLVSLMETVRGLSDIYGKLSF